MKNKIIFWLLFLVTSFTNAQLSTDRWMDYIDELAEETDNTEQIETLYNELSYLVDHPFDLNNVTSEELRKLPFLSDLQIDKILEYRVKYGDMISIYELKNVDALDFQTIELLLPFICIGKIAVNNWPFTVDNFVKYGANELQIRYDKSFQQKKGYFSQSDSILALYPNRKYLGEAFYHSVRYSYAFDNRVQLGFVGEKDAGEPFWNDTNKGYDYYSVHLFVKDIGWLKSLALGDYKMSFGQGLVVSNDFSLNRGSIVTQTEKRSNGFRRHFSTNEIDFFRGIAATFSLSNIELSLFYSYRKMDAKADSGLFTSIQTDGLHRLVREREKRQVVPMQTIGGNIRYSKPNLYFGLTTLSYSFGKYRMQPEIKPYNIFYFRGNSNINMSVDYLIKNRNIKFYGETAVSKNRALATLNEILISPVSYMSILLSYRYYHKRYQAYYGNTFSQNALVQNEQGLYIGLQFVPISYWKLSAYMDIFRFPWLKYGVNAPSIGREYQMRVDYNRGQKFSSYFRYGYRQKEKDSKEEDNFITPIFHYSQHKLRLQTDYSIASSLLLRSSGDVILYKEKRQVNKGFMLAQSITYKPTSTPFQMNFYVAGFYTDNYNTRIYSFEKNVLYAFSMPSFYGRGLRVATSFRLDVWKKLCISAKLAHTYYADRNTIGTDLEEIEGSHKTDLYALFRWKF